MATIPANKRRFDLRYNGKRYLVRLTNWADARLVEMADREKSKFAVEAIFAFAALNGVTTDDLDAVFAALAADEHRLNQTDVVTAAITYAWAIRQR